TNVTAGHTITASFVPKTYTITAGVSGSGGTISPSGAQTVSHGGSLSLSIAPGTGYDIADVVVDGISKGAHTSYAFTNVAAPHSITASFKASNLPPHADAGPDQTVDEGILVTLLGSNSRDPEGSVLSHLWEQVDGPAVQLSSTTTADPTFRAPDVGPEGLALTFRLTVTDDLGARSSDTCIVNVTWVNIPPTADAGADQAVNMGAIVTLDGSGSTDVDDGIASYSWKRVSGPVVETVDWSQPTITFVAPDVASEGASLVFELTVTDHNGLKATDSCIVNVSWVNTPPTSNAGPDQAAYEADTVMLDGSASTDDEGIVSYQWKQTLGTPVALSDPNAPSVQFIAPTISAASETLTFTLTVTDAGTLQSEDTCQVTVHKNSGVDLTGGWKSSSYDGSKFVGTVQVKNAGNLRAGTFRVALYLSSNGTALTRLLKTTTVYGLSAGAAKDLSYSYRARGLSGQSMIAVIDSTGVIQETNEANNRAVVAIK
ncbi:MAG: PKD domain-containing protein, partial [Syntrophobacteraceae bacterium]|nr:PKD domain-containing protein [Syntrophobacteraceae bacterium]